MPAERRYHLGTINQTDALECLLAQGWLNMSQIYCKGFFFILQNIPVTSSSAHHVPLSYLLKVEKVQIAHNLKMCSKIHDIKIRKTSEIKDSHKLWLESKCPIAVIRSLLSLGSRIEKVPKLHSRFSRSPKELLGGQTVAPKPNLAYKFLQEWTHL